MVLEKAASSNTEKLFSTGSGVSSSREGLLWILVSNLSNIGTGFVAQSILAFTLGLTIFFIEKLKSNQEFMLQAIKMYFFQQ